MYSMEPLKGHGEEKQYEIGGIIILRSLSNVLRSHRETLRLLA